MATNFTRINFGWWHFKPELQPDMYEFGISKAAVYDCAATIMIYPHWLDAHPRAKDIFEVFYRWEDAKRTKWLTKEHKELLKNPDCEYILLVNEYGEYELQPYFEIKNAAQGNKEISAFYFERKGKTYVVCWHKSGSGQLKINQSIDDFIYEEQLGGNAVAVESKDNHIILPIAGRRYFSTSATKEVIISAFEDAEVIQ